MNAENELTHTTRMSFMSWRSLWLRLWRFVVTGVMLFCIYYLFALWGVILLVILTWRQVRKVLRWEAQRKT